MDGMTDPNDSTGQSEVEMTDVRELEQFEADTPSAITFPELFARSRSIASRIMGRVRKATEKTDPHVLPPPQAEVETVKADDPPAPPPPS